MWDIYLQVELLDHRVYMHSGLVNFLRRLCQINVYGSFSCTTSLLLPIFYILLVLFDFGFHFSRSGMCVAVSHFGLDMHFSED